MLLEVALQTLAITIVVATMASVIAFAPDDSDR